MGTGCSGRLPAAALLLNALPLPVFLLLLLLLSPGSMGGTIEAICLQPIDVIKTRLQLDKVGKYKGERGGKEKGGGWWNGGGATVSQ
jgi:hypothetical protein